MGATSWLRRLISRVSWVITGIKHRHRPDDMYDCRKCQYEGWLAIAEQYPKNSPQAKNARQRAQEFNYE